MRVFLDANILFSAAKSDGAIRRLLVMLRDAGHECCADDYVVEEAHRNLTAKEGSAVKELGRLPVRILTGSRTAPLEASIDLHEKDRPVLAAAIQYRCDVLLTGDSSHFGHLFEQTIEGVTIHSPRSLAEATF